MQEQSCYIGIELGSTRIKAVLTGKGYEPLSSGEFVWENKFENGVWTYGLDEVWLGMRTAVGALIADAKERGLDLGHVAAIGISAMMHGYLPFGKDDGQLVPFRTWRNTITGPAAEELSELFRFNIPQRWSIAQRGRPCEGYRFPDHSGRICPLEAHRPEGPGRGGRQRHVPH